MKPEDVDYIKGKKGLGVLMPVRDNNGDPMWLTLNSIIPWSGILSAMKRSGSGVMKTMGVDLGPDESQGKLPLPQEFMPGGVGQIGMSALFNKDLYSGMDIADKTPARNYQLLAYIYKGMMPPTNPVPMPVPGTIAHNVQSIGPTAQKLGDAMYSSGVLGDDSEIAKAIMARKESYYGASKGVPFALLDAVLGINISPIQKEQMMVFDAKDFQNAVDASEQIIVKAARDQGLTKTPVGQQVMQNAIIMAKENIERAKEEWAKAHGK